MDKSKTAVAVFDKRANDYQDKFMDVSQYGHSLDLFCDQITTTNADILEVACGPGNVTKYLLNQRPDLKILGLDLAPNMIELAQQNNPTAHFQIMDTREISQLNKQYEGIICGFGLPYLSKDEALQFIANTAALLKPNGLLYLSTMEDDYGKSGWETSSQGDRVFMHYHQADYLTESLAEHVLDVILTERKPYEKRDEMKGTDLILVAKKQS